MNDERDPASLRTLAAQVLERDPPSASRHASPVHRGDASPPRQAAPDASAPEAEAAGGSIEDLARMDLGDFSRSARAIRCRSRALGDVEVILAGERARLPKRWGGVPVYRGEELILLAAIRPSPVELRQLHAVRELFGTTLAEVIDREPEAVRA